MAKDIINFDAIKLTTELTKYNRHKAIPSTFFNGTYTILDVRELYDDLSPKIQEYADELMQQYNVEVKQSEDGLYKSFLNEYKAFIRNQHTREDKWVYKPVMKKYRSNINPVRAISYDVREMAYSYNNNDDHHVWLSQLITEPNFYHRVIQDIIKDREKVDKILNYYIPIYSVAKFTTPIELKHLQTLRMDLLEYAKLFTEFRNYVPDE
tara:strand:- start:310 stop:936 length:627 start_codon:yes stop_codon:yes gene_type:complete